MSNLSIYLFGKFGARCGEQALNGLDAFRIQELLSYLLLHRDRPHPRETLADLLWGDNVTEKAKKYLRQTLWQLQTALDSPLKLDNGGGVLRVEHDWVQLNSQSALWLDVAIFEEAFAGMRRKAGQPLDQENVQRLEEAVRLYKGDLLEGWYQDWCFYERERLQNMYLMMLDKLMGHCAEHLKLEKGIDYGALILRHDRAREHTHRQLMQLLYMSGDRTGALRQYERCVAALKEELDVKPDRRTLALYEQIRSGELQTLPLPSQATMQGREPQQPPHTALPHVLGQLKQLQKMLGHIQQQLKKEINDAEGALHNQPNEDKPTA